MVKMDDLDPELQPPIVLHVGMSVRVRLPNTAIDGYEGVLRKVDMTLNYEDMAGGTERHLIPIGMIENLIINLNYLEPV